MHAPVFCDTRLPSHECDTERHTHTDSFDMYAHLHIETRLYACEGRTDTDALTQTLKYQVRRFDFENMYTGGRAVRCSAPSAHAEADAWAAAIRSRMTDKTVMLVLESPCRVTGR